ncbi:MAG TPA: Na+/H+ antiporter NhaA [Coriobacteriia bacterium]|nr:Na+/H+ antiporter NhaA [Coriobacteriia bacterium]
MSATGVGPGKGLGRMREGVAEFMHQESSGAIVLAVATLAALLIANSPLHAGFEHLWELKAGFHMGDLVFDQSLRHWVDDGLMAIFFFVVGLEIKREFVVGELSTVRGATLPVVAALGGMIVPAGLYIALNFGGPGAHGWGVPMATDIAFALGVLAILGSRIPSGLKVFLTALAIADDIGAIVVIAIFYTTNLQSMWLIWALVPIAVLFAMNRLGVDEPLAYLAVAAVLWFMVLNSGIHATIAGVVAAMLVPTVSRLTPAQFVDACRIAAEDIEAADVPGAHTLENDHQQHVALQLARAAQHSAAPLQRLELALHPFSTFVILPLFALANAGVRIVGEAGVGRLDGAGVGVIVGLVLGKPLGIALASFAAVALGLASLPSGVNWRHIIGAGMLGGIGFTMSMFVANLAFRSAAMTAEVKGAILIASVVAAAFGYAWLRFGTDPSAATGDDA